MECMLPLLLEYTPNLINADPRFLLAQLHMDSLKNQPTLGHIKLALRNLPRGVKGLDETYKQAMERIQHQAESYRKLANQVLSWLTHTRRALTTKEMQHAVAVTPDMPDFDQDFLPGIEMLDSICAGLVTVDKDSDSIRLVHFTAQEFFVRTSWFPNAQTDITATCITYLSFSAFEAGFCQTDEEFEARLRSNVLYDYAARNWGKHAYAASMEVEKLVLDFLQSETKVSSSSQAMIATKGSYYRGYSQRVPKQMTGVHLAAYFGLRNTIMALLKNGHNPDSRNTDRQTPLWWAARNGHEAVVKVLLAIDGIDVNSRDNLDGWTPLAWAAGNGHEAVVVLLLAKGGIDLNSRDNNNGRTSLSWAAGRGHEAVVKVLLAADGVNVDSRDLDGRTPLAWAAGNEHEAVVMLLLAKDGVDPNSKFKDSNYDWTPLLWAARNGNEGVVKLLLADNRINPDSKSDYGDWTSLSWAADYGHEAVVKLLLANNRVDPNSKDMRGQTPLSWAARHGREAVAKLLLANICVDPDSKDKNNWTPLTWAAANGHEAVVKLLLAKEGVNPYNQDKYGRTPLSWAAANGHEAVVKVLLAKGGVDPDSKV